MADVTAGKLSAKQLWHQMRHELRLMWRLHRVRATEGGANYRARAWLSDRIKGYIGRLRIGGHQALVDPSPRRDHFRIQRDKTDG